MKSILIVFFTLTSWFVFAQKDTVVYFSQFFEPIPYMSKAERYSSIKQIGKEQFEESNFYRSNWSWKEAETKSIFKIESDTSFYEETIREGKKLDVSLWTCRKIDKGFYLVKSAGEQILEKRVSKLKFPLIKTGLWINYDKKTNKLDNEEIFVNNKVVSTKIWLTETEFIDSVYTYVDKPAELMGGIPQFLMENVQYPKEAIKKNVQGKVYVRFIVTDKGEIKGCKIMKGHVLLDNEVLRVIKASTNHWNPAMIEDRKVNMVMVLPVNFAFN